MGSHLKFIENINVKKAVIRLTGTRAYIPNLSYIARIKNNKN